MDRRIGRGGRLTAAALVLGCVGSLGVDVVFGADRQPAPSASQALSPLYDCRQISDPNGRLACYDAAVAKLADAQNQGAIQVFDREQLRQTRRSLFGFDLPRLAILSGPSEKNGAAEELAHVEGAVASATRDQDGAWLIILEDGARWRQTDANTLGRWPKKGMPVTIDRGMLGSYKMSIARQPGIKVRREG